MKDASDNHRGDGNLRKAGEGASVSEVKAWFVREVLPLEGMLLQFLRKSSSSAADAEDICQEVYMRIFASARKELPNPTKPLLFKVARDLLVDRARRQQVVSIQAVENLEALDVAIDEPGPDRTVIAREELRKLQAALDKLPERYRKPFLMKKIDGLTTREIAVRLGVAEKTVEMYLTEAVRALADVLYRDQLQIGGPA
jgi:RNA polymerase sigma-70 factor (ECF subfamily)